MLVLQIFTARLGDFLLIRQLGSTSRKSTAIENGIDGIMTHLRIHLIAHMLTLTFGMKITESNGV